MTAGLFLLLKVVTADADYYEGECRVIASYLRCSLDCG